jgi:hypothetical protein
MKGGPAHTFPAEGAFVLHRPHVVTAYRLLSTELGLSGLITICSLKTCVCSTLSGTKFGFFTRD